MPSLFLFCNPIISFTVCALAAVLCSRLLCGGSSSGLHLNSRSSRLLAFASTAEASRLLSLSSTAGAAAPQPLPRQREQQAPQPLPRQREQQAPQPLPRQREQPAPQPLPQQQEHALHGPSPQRSIHSSGLLPLASCQDLRIAPKSAPIPTVSMHLPPAQEERTRTVPLGFGSTDHI